MVFRNEISANIFTFYLRTDTFDSDTNKWTPQVPKINGCFLEITATEPETEEVLYLPFRYQFTKEQFEGFIQPHRTTVIDVTLARLPSPDVFRAVKF